MHLEWFGDPTSQTAFIAEWFAAHVPGPAIVLGDFNLEPSGAQVWPVALFITCTEIVLKWLTVKTGDVLKLLTAAEREDPLTRGPARSQAGTRMHQMHPVGTAWWPTAGVAPPPLSARARARRTSASRLSPPPRSPTGLISP